MKKIILLFVITLVSTSMFAQNDTPTDAAILKLMNVKKGMLSVNSLTDNMTKNMSATQIKNFKAEMDLYKSELIKKSIDTFKKEYTAKEINFIYEECTSDKIDYTDLTNGFFRK
ncbi:MAG TPA: hypothetical protein EYP87_08235, partial [Flavobacteriaceae bacterium]|nr:hypothetical protein [Flavobacteriaceae bacterium]